MQTNKKAIYLGILFVVILLSSDPSPDQMIPHGVSKGEIIIARSGNISVFDKGVMQMPVECLLDVRDILHLGNATHADLLAPVLVRDRFSGHFSQLLLARFHEK